MAPRPLLTVRLQARHRLSQPLVLIGIVAKAVLESYVRCKRYQQY